MEHQANLSSSLETSDSSNHVFRVSVLLNMCSIKYTMVIISSNSKV